MREMPPVLSMLIRHFFRRFFDNDTLQVDGDTRVSVIRALATVVVPGLMVAFFLQNQYPQRDVAGRLEDEYFFVLTTFVVMALVTLFQWDMLFPDVADFLVLTPLPLRATQVMTAKAVALCGFMALFVFSSTMPGALMYSAIAHEPFFRHLIAHVVSVIVAGVFSSASLIALAGVLRCVLSNRLFRMATVMLRTVITTGIVLLVVQYLRYEAALQLLMRHPMEARWFPPLWFLALYDRLLHGSSASEFARVLMPHALWSTAAVLLSAAAVYPGAWGRMRKMTLEGTAAQHGSPSARWSRFLEGAVPCAPERAMVRFIGQTMQRTAQYQVYLAMYAGAGLGLAITCCVTLYNDGSSVAVHVSRFGLHAVYPLLSFWLIAGLRTAFAFPVALQARWVFRISGVNDRELAAASRRSARVLALMLLCATLTLIALTGCTPRELLIQFVYGVSLALSLPDAFFFSRTAPLIQPRTPGRANFALFLTLYIGVLAPALFAIVYAELRSERSLWLGLIPLVASCSLHAVVHHLHTVKMEVEEDMEGYDPEIQLLNLG